MPGAGSGSNPHGNSSSRQYRQKGADTSVFQLSATETLHLSLNDVRDAYEACSTARSTKERRQCFEVYGLDADKVDRYYERVVQMERLIDQGDSVGQSLVTSGGAFMLYFIAACIVKV